MKKVTAYTDKDGNFHLTRSECCKFDFVHDLNKLESFHKLDIAAIDFVKFLVQNDEAIKNFYENFKRHTIQDIENPIPSAIKLN